MATYPEASLPYCIGSGLISATLAFLPSSAVADGNQKGIPSILTRVPAGKVIGSPLLSGTGIAALQAPLLSPITVTSVLYV